MKFDLMSDLHVDLSASYKLDYSSMATSSIAVVAGDVSNDPYTTIFELEKIASHYDRVLFVDGNHEHYDNRSESRNRANRMPPQTYAIFRSEFESHPKIVYLDQGRNAFLIDGTAFIGANGWYDFNHQAKQDHCITTWYDKMNDPHWANIDHEWVWNEAIRHSSNLTATVAAMNQNPNVKEIVLVTHTIPHEKGLYQHPSNLTWNLLNGCYLNSLSKRAHFGKVKVHCFGHTHRRQNFNVDGIDFVCNPRGYQGEPSFENWTPIQVDTDLHYLSAFGEIE